MNKKEVITEISERTGVSVDDCAKVLDAFENVLGDKLSNSKGVGNAFDKVYSVLSFFKNKKDNK